MMKQIFSLLFIATMVLFSCTKDSDLIDEQSVTDAVLESRTVTNDCFQFVFPVSFQLPDQSVVQVNSIDEAKILRDSVKGKIRLVFPVDIVNSSGETVTIADHEQMHTVLLDCGFIEQHRKGGKHGKGGHDGKGGKGLGGFGNGGDHGNGNYVGNGGHNDHPKCFDIVFPVNMIFPDGAVKSFSDEISMQEAIRTWMKANPGKKDRPEFQFPIQVIKQGETEPVTISSKEELEALRKNC